jgi:hypothetical protein
LRAASQCDGDIVRGLFSCPAISWLLPWRCIAALSPPQFPVGIVTTLYWLFEQYDCSDGFNPAAGLIMDKHGQRYGTAEYGGSTSCDHGCGMIFKLIK